jgi:hypothetical protein
MDEGLKRDLFLVGFIIFIILVSLYLYYTKTYIEEDIHETRINTVSVITESSEMSNILSENNKDLDGLYLIIEDLQLKSENDSNFQQVVDILTAEHNLLIMKNDQIKELFLENEDLAYDSGINVEPFFVSGMTMGVNMRDQVNLKSRSEHILSSINDKLKSDNVTGLEKGVVKSITEYNEKSIQKAKTVTNNIQNSGRVVKSKKLTIEEINAKRVSKGKPVINREKLLERKNKINVRKQEKNIKREELRTARLKFKNEEDPIKRRVAKSEFLMFLQKYKNREKKDSMEEKTLGVDESILSLGEDVRETKPVVDIVDAVKANSDVAKNIDSEIMIKEKIIVDTVADIEEGKSSGEVIEKLMSQLSEDTELSLEEESLIASVDI